MIPPIVAALVAMNAAVAAKHAQLEVARNAESPNREEIVRLTAELSGMASALQEVIAQGESYLNRNDSKEES